ncbi:substrate binding domain-containing protein, partial [Pseudomonas tolaasii]|uniref:substrate binding domain-containing protein n=1 Tax=Pseudomonas tolaasii TaxID=29442 RepID=UPI0017CF8153
VPLLPKPLFRDTVDIALRFGVPRDSSLVALPVVPGHHRIPCASPDYLARHGTPQTPADLAHHSTLRYMRRGQANSTWYFRQGALLQEVEISGDYLSDDGEIVRRWALAGHGIAYKAHLDVARDIKAGRLVPLLPGWQGEPTPFNLMCPHRLQVSERVKVLHGFLQARCEALLHE